MNGSDIIEENDKRLALLGLVNGDLVYAFSSIPDEAGCDRNTMISKLIDMGFDKVGGLCSCPHINHRNYKPQERKGNNLKCSNEGKI